MTDVRRDHGGSRSLTVAAQFTPWKRVSLSSLCFGPVDNFSVKFWVSLKFEFISFVPKVFIDFALNRSVENVQKCVSLLHFAACLAICKILER
jgi:hypothetical protein